VDAAARRLWVSDQTNSRIYEISLPPATVSTNEPSFAASGLSLAIWPNPVRVAADIRLNLVRAMDVQFDVVDARGRRVRRVELGNLPAGAFHASWDTRDDRGRRVASGVYFVRVVTDDEVRSTKVVVLR
jgi:hypothetical protein